MFVKENPDRKKKKNVSHAIYPLLSICIPCFRSESNSELLRWNIRWIFLQKLFTGATRQLFRKKLHLRCCTEFEYHSVEAWCKSGTLGPPQSLKVGPGTPLKFKSGTPGPPSKFKSGTLIIRFLHCLTYFVLDKYIDI